MEQLEIFHAAGCTTDEDNPRVRAFYQRRAAKEILGEEDHINCAEVN